MKCIECGHRLPKYRSVVCSVACFETRRKRRAKEIRDDERLAQAIAEITRAQLPTLPKLTNPRLPAGPFWGGWKACSK